MGMLHSKRGVLFSIVIILVLGGIITAGTNYFVSNQLSKAETAVFAEAGAALEISEDSDFEAYLLEDEVQDRERKEEFLEETQELFSKRITLEDNPEGYVISEEEANSTVEIYIDFDSNVNGQKTPRENYEAKLVEMENQIAKLWSEETNNTSYSMLKTADYELAAWDQELNTIYQMLKKKLTPDEFEELRLEERQWILFRDETAMESARQNAGPGSEDISERLSYQKAMAEETKKRTYELVDYYFSK